MGNGNASSERSNKQRAIRRFDVLTAALTGNYYHDRDIHDAIAREAELARTLPCSS